MPGGDGTGPCGDGRLGRGLGPCGRGMRKGFGRGFGRRVAWQQLEPASMTKEEQIKVLEAEKQAIEKQLEELK